MCMKWCCVQLILKNTSLSLPFCSMIHYSAGLEISGGHGRGCPRHWPRCPRENYYYQGQYWPCPFYPLASVPFAGIGIGQMRLWEWQKNESYVPKKRGYYSRKMMKSMLAYRGHRTWITNCDRKLNIITVLTLVVGVKTYRILTVHECEPIQLINIRPLRGLSLHFRNVVQWEIQS